MNKPLFLFVGKSASGKTSAVEKLEELSYNSLQSYTTRAPRYDGEPGHIFISDEEFDKLDHIVAYTEYNGKRYCATKEQIDETDLYVVDPLGVEALLKNYDTERPICIFYFDASVFNRINRMIDRGASDLEIISRLLTDEKSDWEADLGHLVWIYGKTPNKDVQLYKINANYSKSQVMDQVLYYMNKYVED